MKLIIGLGNPGANYEGTRHNVGADFLRQLHTREAGDKAAKNLGDAEVFEMNLGQDRRPRVALLPQGGMNNSGSPVAHWLRNSNVETNEILIVHDDLELSFGEIQVATGGSARGHNGVRSVQEHLGTTDIPRLRIGIGRPPEEGQVADFVLGPFTAEEQVQLPHIFEQVERVLDQADLNP